MRRNMDDQTKKENLQNAVLDAAKIVERAADVAKELVTSTNNRITTSLADALREVFGEHEDAKRFVDVTRIPLICKSIIDMSKSIEDINTKLDTKLVNQDQFTPVKQLVYGLVALILVAVVGAVLTIVIK